MWASYNEYEHFDKLCEKHQSLYGNQFSYTLVDNRARARAKRRLILNYSLGVLGFLGAYGIYKALK